MKTLSLMLAGLGIAAGAVPVAAQAAPFQSINQRQARLDQRIDQGIRSGTLNRREATRIRAEFRTLSSLEYRYRRSGGGLTNWERTDLNRRYDVLSSRVRYEKNDRQGRRR